METIKFVNELKHTLWNIKIVGGNPTVYVTPNYELLKRLREFIVEKTKDGQIPVTTDGWRCSSFFEDVLNTGRFEKRIQYCVIKLREFSISGNDYFTYISQALDIFLCQSERKYNSSQKKNTSFQNLLAEEVAKCFEIWYYPSEVQYYDLATEHQLIYFDYARQIWSLSSLGEYLRSPPSFRGDCLPLCCRSNLGAPRFK